MREGKIRGICEEEGGGERGDETDDHQRKILGIRRRRRMNMFIIDGRANEEGDVHHKENRKGLTREGKGGGEEEGEG